MAKTIEKVIKNEFLNVFIKYKKIRNVIIRIGLFFLCLQNTVLSQSNYTLFPIDTLLIKFHISKVEQKRLQFPCTIINSSIDTTYQNLDTIYQNKDTLCIVWKDMRTFYRSKDTKKTLIVYKCFLKPMKRNFVIRLILPKKYEESTNFLSLHIFDDICLFKKDKKKYAVYKFVSMREYIDYNNKQFLDVDGNLDGVHIK